MLGWFKSQRAVEPEPSPDTDGPVNRGVRAASLLQDPLVREALKAWEGIALTNFRASKNDEEMRYAKAQLEAVEGLARYLRGIMEKGKHEAAQAERERVRRKAA